MAGSSEFPPAEDSEPPRLPEWCKLQQAALGWEINEKLREAAMWDLVGEKAEELRKPNQLYEVDPSDETSLSAMFMGLAARKKARLDSGVAELLERLVRSVHAANAGQLTEAEIAALHTDVDKITPWAPRLVPGSQLAKMTEEKINASLFYRTKELMKDIGQIHQQVAVDGLATVLDRVSAMPPYENPSGILPDDNAV